MRAVLSTGVAIRISFRHYRHLGPEQDQSARGWNYIEEGIERVERRMGLRPCTLNAATECFLTPEGQAQDAPQGWSGCSIHDDWDVEEGRRVALARAIQNTIPRENKADREAVWNAYFSRGSEPVAAEGSASSDYLGIHPSCP